MGCNDCDKNETTTYAKGNYVYNTHDNNWHNGMGDSPKCGCDVCPTSHCGDPSCFDLNFNINVPDQLTNTVNINTGRVRAFGLSNVNPILLKLIKGFHCLTKNITQAIRDLYEKTETNTSNIQDLTNRVVALELENESLKSRIEALEV